MQGQENIHSITQVPRTELDVITVTSKHLPYMETIMWSTPSFSSTALHVRFSEVHHNAWFSCKQVCTLYTENNLPSMLASQVTCDLSHSSSSSCAHAAASFIKDVHGNTILHIRFYVLSLTTLIKLLLPDESTSSVWTERKCHALITQARSEPSTGQKQSMRRNTYTLHYK